MLDVIKIMLNFDASVVCVSSVSVNNLRPTCNAWLNHMTISVEGYFNTELINKHMLLRSWANNTHIALKHVYKLWNLIYTSFTNKLTYTCYTHIICLSKLWTV